MCVILEFVVGFDSSVHGTVSRLRNRFLFVTVSRTLGFGRRRYGRLFLAIAGLFVYI